MSNYVHARNIARQRTSGAVSGALLEAFPGLVAIGDETAPPYRDIRITGPVMATWKEATILHTLVKYAKPNRALEIGTSVGWTAAHIASALPAGGYLSCIDPFTETATGLDTQNIEIATWLHENMERAGVADRYEIYTQESPAILPRVAENTGPWDFAFIDGWHLNGQPLRDVEGVMPHMAEKGIVVLHDLLIPDVMEAGRALAQNGYYFTGFISRHHLGVFVRGGSVEKMPRWWNKFMRDVDNIFLQE